LGTVHLNRATAKINLLGLVSIGPRDLTTGLPLDLAATFDRASPVRDIIADRAVPLAQTFANRIVPGVVANRPVRSLLSDVDPDVAASHLVDEHGQALLASGRLEPFLRHRHQLVTAAVLAHVDTMAEWGARDGRSTADMIRSVA
jgi:hypothetical protein